MSNPFAQPYVALPNSEKQAVPGAQEVGDVDPNEVTQVSIYLRPGTSAPPLESAGTMTREQYAATYGADPADVARIVAFAQTHGLTVVQTDLARRVIVLKGTVGALTQAFQIQLRRYVHQGNTFRGRTGTIQVPQDLAPMIVGVFGLDDREQAHAHMRIARPMPGSPLTQAAVATRGFTAVDLAGLYNFPANSTGQGQTIALIELGGGYQPSDIQTYFSQLGLTPPTVVAVPVDGSQNAPTGNANSADGEVLLDIEVAGGVAPGAKIAVYFGPNTDQGFIDAISTAVHDTQNTPTVISISWGGPESSWTAQATQQMNQVFQQAGTLGITVCCAAGDGGSDDGVGDGKAHCDYPASSPYVLGCGGTHLEASATVITSETVWNDGQGATGGGISDLFTVPAWQQNANIPPSVNDQHAGRGVPDVAGDASPQSGYSVLVDGQATVIGGTSAVAPLYAGLFARINQALGKSVGFVNPTLYQHTNIFRDITSGNNALNGAPGYDAGGGWDACTGLGMADGTKLLTALQAG